MTKKEKALALRKQGYNCAQAVACSFCEDFNLPTEFVFAACEAFGTGMGGMAGTCGAVSGAVLLAGLRNSNKDLEKASSKAATCKVSRAITAAFEEKNSSLVCRELKGVTTARVLRSCPDCICDAVELVEMYVK